MDRFGDLHLDDLRVELGNFRVALDWADSDIEGCVAGLSLAARLQALWTSDGHHEEGLSRLVRLLGRGIGSTEVRAEAACRAGYIAEDLGEDEQHARALGAGAARGDHRRRQALGGPARHELSVRDPRRRRRCHCPPAPRHGDRLTTSERSDHLYATCTLGLANLDGSPVPSMRRPTVRADSRGFVGYDSPRSRLRPRAISAISCVYRGATPPPARKEQGTVARRVNGEHHCPRSSAPSRPRRNRVHPRKPRRRRRPHRHRRIAQPRHRTHLGPEPPDRSEPTSHSPVSDNDDPRIRRTSGGTRARRRTAPALGASSPSLPRRRSTRRRQHHRCRHGLPPDDRQGDCRTLCVPTRRRPRRCRRNRRGPRQVPRRQRAPRYRRDDPRPTRSKRLPGPPSTTSSSPSTASTAAPDRAGTTRTTPRSLSCSKGYLT